MSASGTYLVLDVLQTVTGNAGGAVAPAAGNLTLVGAGDITVTGTPLTNTLTITYTGMGGSWIPKTTNFTMSNGTGYICSTAPVIGTLPAIAAVGDVYSVIGIDANPFQIAVNAGQSIIISDYTTTVTTGTITSTALGDSLEILCVVANTKFFIVSQQGNFTVT